MINFNSFASMVSQLPTETACREYLELQRWGGIPTCPHCGTMDNNHYKLTTKGVFKGMYKCRACKERFTVTIGTMFEGSHVSLHKWFIATYIFSSHKKGISSHQLARDLGVTQKTAWFMLHRLREAFNVDKSGEQIGGEGVVVEVDETVIGGKVANMNNKSQKSWKAKNRKGDIDNKTLVIGYQEREGKLVLNKLSRARGIQDVVKKSVDKGSVIMTDSAPHYKKMDEHFAHHGVVDHRAGEYGRGIYHTNSIEGVFSHFDRMVIGIYHYVSPKHIQKYLNEFCFRFNSRKEGDKTRFDFALKSTQGIKVMYSQLTAKC